MRSRRAGSRVGILGVIERWFEAEGGGRVELGNALLEWLLHRLVIEMLTAICNNILGAPARWPELPLLHDLTIIKEAADVGLARLLHL